MSLARLFKAGDETAHNPASRQRRVRVSREAPVANTYTALFYHVVFSTKNRTAYIKPESEHRVWAYIGGVARKHGMTALQVGGVEDHIHALVMAPPTLAPSEVAKFLKGDSSKWVHEEFPDWRGFAWQDGYGAFTVSKSSLSSVVGYIRNQ